MAGHLIIETDDLENVGHCEQFTKILIFEARVFPKNSKRQISLRVAGNEKMEWVRIR